MARQLIIQLLVNISTPKEWVDPQNEEAIEKILYQVDHVDVEDEILAVVGARIERAGYHPSEVQVSVRQD